MAPVQPTPWYEEDDVPSKLLRDILAKIVQKSRRQSRAASHPGGGEPDDLDDDESSLSFTGATSVRRALRMLARFGAPCEVVGLNNARRDTVGGLHISFTRIEERLINRLIHEFGACCERRCFQRIATPLFS